MRIPAIHVGVFHRNNWYQTKDHREHKNGWLHFKLGDGSIGLARPGEWKPLTELKKQGFVVKKVS